MRCVGIALREDDSLAEDAGRTRGFSRGSGRNPSSNFIFRSVGHESAEDVDLEGGRDGPAALVEIFVFRLRRPLRAESRGRSSGTGITGIGAGP